eukprot:m.82090 g.82090  ORF g.82090 m.82090 type:complete len:149 (-) comp8103_c0_seq4:277-723(-)
MGAMLPLASRHCASFLQEVEVLLSNTGVARTSVNKKVDLRDGHATASRTSTNRETILFDVSCVVVDRNELHAMKFGLEETPASDERIFNIAGSIEHNITLASNEELAVHVRNPLSVLQRRVEGIQRNIALKCLLIALLFWGELNGSGS